MKSRVDYIYYYNEVKSPLLSIRIKLNEKELTLITDKMKTLKDYKCEFFRDPIYGLYALVSKRNDLSQNAETFVGESVLTLVQTLSK